MTSERQRAQRPPAGVPRRWRMPVAIRASLAVHLGALGAAATGLCDWRAAIGAVALNHGLLAAAGFVPGSQALGPTLVRLPAHAPSDAIALSFDDGPDPDITPRVLDMLEQAGARATFFCVGTRVMAHRGLAAEIVARGHSLENHSHRHSMLFPWMPPGALRRELLDAQRAITQATGRAPCLFRAPFGVRTPWLDPVLARLGLVHVGWSARAFDTVRPDGALLGRQLARAARPGAILLLHDGRASGARAAHPAVLDALPIVLDRIRRSGLRTVDIRALLADVPGAHGVSRLV